MPVLLFSRAADGLAIREGETKSPLPEDSRRGYATTASFLLSSSPGSLDPELDLAPWLPEPVLRNGCRGFNGPVPQPLSIRVARSIAKRRPESNAIFQRTGITIVRCNTFPAHSLLPPRWCRTWSHRRPSQRLHGSASRYHESRVDTSNRANGRDATHLLRSPAQLRRT